MSEIHLEREIVQLALQLIAIRTVNGSFSHYRKCLNFIERYFQDISGIRFFHYTKNHFPSLVITNSSKKNTDIILNGHIDVVPGKAQQFRPQIRGKRLFGRGSKDMKGGVAVLMKLFKDVVCHYSNAPKIALMIVSDEESGGQNGTGYLLKKGWRSKFALIPEGRNDFSLVNREKGVVDIKICARGKTAHGAYPWLGINAVERLLEGYRKISKLFPKPNPHRWQSTISLNKIISPRDILGNQIPHYAEGLIHIRYTPDLGNTPEEVMRKIQAQAPDLKYQILRSCSCFCCPQDNPYFRRLYSIARRISKNVSIRFNHGASDAVYFAERGIPAMVSGIVGRNHHADNEYVSIPSLRDYYFLAGEFIREFKNI